ncbi:RN111-like protein [Mya arenaria]|uniref:RING-type E3 ubiquitin transferase n=1 Tax=Mya arenaria TaxID=6604 RepID=A0ABY7DYY9_MYAAR|nr:RN111-like protein [Mya arenaria]
MHSCTCRLRGSDRRSNDSELIGRANSARNTGACGIQQQENVGGFYGRESPVIQNSGLTEGFLANDRYAQAGNTSPQPSTSGLVGNRPPRRRQDLSSRATVVVDLTEGDCDDPSILATAGAPNSLTPTFDLDLHPDNRDLDQQLEESSRRHLPEREQWKISLPCTQPLDSTSPLITAKRGPSSHLSTLQYAKITKHYPPISAVFPVPAPHPHQHQQLPPHQDNLRMLDLLRAQFQHAQLVQGSNLLQIPPHSLVETQPPMAHSQTSCSLDSAPRPPANNQHPQSTPQGQHQHLHHHLHHYHHAGVPRLRHFAAVPGVHHGRPFPEFPAVPDFQTFPPVPPSFGMLPRNVQMRLQLGRMMFNPHRPPTYEELLHLEERLGNVNRGASQDVKIINEDEEDDSNHMEKCTICLSEFENDEDM